MTTPAVPPSPRPTASDAALNTALGDGAPKTEKKPPTEEDILQALEPGYYTAAFNPLAALLEKLPPNANLQWIETEEDQRRVAEDAVNSRLSSRIMSNYDSFLKAMVDIRVLGSELQLTARLAQNARLSLKTAEGQLTRPAFHLLARAQRRGRLNVVLGLLKKISQLMDSEKETEAATAAGNYAGAIEMCLNCQMLVADLKELQCVAPFYTTLQSRYQAIHTRLDCALADQTRNFSKEEYSRILEAFRLLGRTEGLLERVQKHFREQIISAVRDTLLKHAPPIAEERGPDGSKRPLSSKKICSSITDADAFVACVHELLSRLCDLLHTHYLLHKHATNGSACASEVTAFYAHVRGGLERFRKAVWEDMQKFVSILITASPAPGALKIDEFLPLLESVSRFTDIGEDFAKSRATTLTQAMQTVSRRCFLIYHHSRLDALKTMLEHEMWVLCPVAPSFSPSEISFEWRDFIHTASRVTQPFGALGSGPGLASSAESVCVFFEAYAANGNPFAARAAKRASELSLEEMAPNDSDSDEELQQREVDEDGPSRSPAKSSAASSPSSPAPSPALGSPSQARKNNGSNANAEQGGPILTSTSSTAARFIGKYLQMMKLLPPIALDVFSGVTLMYDYYLYSLYHFFAANDRAPMTSKLRTGLTMVRERLFKPAPAVQPGSPQPERSVSPLPSGQQTQVQREGGDATDERKQLVLPARGAALVGTPFEMLQRAGVGIESLAFLAEAMTGIKGPLLHFLPKAHVTLLTEFFGSSVAMVDELRFHVFKANIPLCINFDPYVRIIPELKWDMKDFGLEHNTYVNDLIRDLRTFSTKLAELRELPPRSKKVAWETMLYLLMESIVEKCNNEGRAQMSLDWQTLHSALIKLSTIKPNPSFVETYIKGYYEEDLEAWAKQHPEYTPRQLTSLKDLKKKTWF